MVLFILFSRKNKRQFTIEDAKIKHIFDSKLTIQDEMLQEVLSRKNNDYMKNIVNTIHLQELLNIIVRLILLLNFRMNINSNYIQLIKIGRITNLKIHMTSVYMALRV